MAKFSSICSFGKDLCADAHKPVSIAMPFLSGSFVLAKNIWGTEVSALYKISYAWALLPLLVWVLIAYAHRRAMYSTTEPEITYSPEMSGCVNTWSDENEEKHKQLKVIVRNPFTAKKATTCRGRVVSIQKLTGNPRPEYTSPVQFTWHLTPTDRSQVNETNLFLARGERGELNLIEMNNQGSPPRLITMQHARYAPAFDVEPAQYRMNVGIYLGDADATEKIVAFLFTWTGDMETSTLVMETDKWEQENISASKKLAKRESLSAFAKNTLPAAMKKSSITFFKVWRTLKAQKKT